MAPKYVNLKEKKNIRGPSFRWTKTEHLIERASSAEVLSAVIWCRTKDADVSHGPPLATRPAGGRRGLLEPTGRPDVLQRDRFKPYK